MHPLQPPAEELRTTVTHEGLQIAARTGRGGRERNEDSLSIIPAGTGVLLAVADGLGGHIGGEVASSAFCAAVTALAAEHLSGPAGEVALSRLYEAAAARVQQAITQSYAETARTTCALVWLHPQGLVALTVGDTRIYILREGEIGSWRSRDHSIAELALHDVRQEGTAAVSEADRARLYKSLGLKSIPDPTVASHTPLGAGDSVVVCSDGVWGCVAIDDLLDVGASADLPAAVDAVVERAIGFAGADADNATLVVARPQPQATPAGRLARAPGLLRGSVVTLPATGSFTVMGVLRATPESVTYVMQDEEQRVRWLKELDPQLQPDAMSAAYLPETRRLPAALCPPLERADTEHAQLVAFTGAGGTPLGWPANSPAEQPADFPRSLFMALADCHREGIVHGAIRPRNIAWRPNGQIVFLEPVLRKDTASAQQDVADLLHICCALEKPGSARRAKLQALTLTEKLTAAEVVAQLDSRAFSRGRRPGGSGFLSWLRMALPAVAIAAAVIAAWIAMRPYGIIPPPGSPEERPSPAPDALQVSQASASAVSASAPQPLPAAAALAATLPAAPVPVEAGEETLVRLQITAAGGKPVPPGTVRVWANDSAVDATKGFSLQRRSYNLVVEAQGYERYERVLDASRGGHMEVPVQLQKIPVAAQEPAQDVDSGEPPAAAAPVSSKASRPAGKPACPGGAASCLNLTPPPCVSGDDCNHSTESSAAGATAPPDPAAPAPKSPPSPPSPPATDHDSGPPDP